MSRHADLSDSDFQGLTKEASDRAQLEMMAHQDEQPGPHARFGWPLVLSVGAILLGYNGPAIFNAIRQLFGV